MATSYVDYTGDGNATKAFSFPSLAETDVKVEVDGVVKTAATHYNITSYNSTSGGNVVFTAGNIPTSSNDIRIYRDTDISTNTGAYDPQATFTAGASVKADDLNNNQKQALYAIWEEKEQTITAQDLKDNSITSSKIVGNAINSAHLADNSVGSSELQSDSVGTTQIKDNAVTSAKIAGDAVGSAQIADNSVTSAKIAGNAVGSAQIADGAVGASEIAADAVRAAQIQAGAVGSSEIAGNAVNSAHIADGAVGSSEIAANAVGSAQIADGAVGASEIAADAVRSAQIQDGAVGSSEIAADAVGNAQLADNSVSAANIAANAVGSAQIADGAVGSSELDANSVGNVQLKDNAVTMDEIGCEQTTITDDDTKLPTSGAVVDYVNTRLAPIGGLEVIADDESFEEVADMPPAGVVVSITDAAGLSVNSSGVSTNGDTKTTNATVTINNFPTELRGGATVGGVTNADPYVFGSGAGLMVVSTGSSNTYNYHQALIRETDFVRLSGDIDDFNQRYRVTADASGVRTGVCGADGTGSGSYPCDGDMAWFTGSNKMYVFDAPAASTSNSDLDAAWTEVSSTGEFKILGIKDNGQAHNGSGPTFNGSNDQYDLFEGTSDASLTQAAQLIVVLNGVIQKPNDGVFSASGEGFYLDGTDGIRFCDPPPTGSTLFVTKCGSAVSVNVPADNSVTAGKTDISLVQGDIIYSNGTDSWTRLAKGTAGQVLKMNSGATAPEWGTDNNDNTQLTQEQVEDFVGGMLDGTETGISVTYDDTDGNIDFVVDDTTKLPLAGGTITGDVLFDNGTNAGKDMLWDVSDDTLKLNDDVQLSLGTDRDMRFYHTGSHGYLNVVTGNLEIRTNSNENAIICTANAGVDLYYDNTQEFATVSGGVKLYGHSESVVTALTSASSVTIDFSLSNHFSCTMGHNITFANPTTESVGQSGTIVLTQDGTGSRTASWGSQFLWAGGTAPTLSTAANAVDRIDYFVAAADKIHCVASLGMA